MLVAPSESISLPNSTKLVLQTRPDWTGLDWTRADQYKLKCGRKQILELRRCAPLTFSCVMILLLSNSFCTYFVQAHLFAWMSCLPNKSTKTLLSKTRSPFKERQEDILKAINQDNALESLSHASGGFELQELALFWLNKIQQKLKGTTTTNDMNKQMILWE